jgi:hypothetical protein
MVAALPMIHLLNAAGRGYPSSILGERTYGNAKLLLSISNRSKPVGGYPRRPNSLIR